MKVQLVISDYSTVAYIKPQLVSKSVIKARNVSGPISTSFIAKPNKARRCRRRQQLTLLLHQQQRLGAGKQPSSRLLPVNR
jgi:hypothetical protein